jgi:hypothetical protein
MSLLQKVYSVGTTPVTVVAPTADYVKYVLKNIQPKDVDEYARDGYMYVIGQQFTITSGGTVNFSIATGATGAQLDFYTIISDTATVLSSLVEGATVTTTGSDLPAYNLNRNFPDTHNAVLKAASSITGGTAVSQEFTTASIHAGGELSSTKVHTLKPNATYGMRFVNLGNQTTSVFFQLGFSEHYNGYNNIWLETVNDSFVLRPNEEILMELLPNATINATALINSNKLSVMRQK